MFRTFLLPLILALFAAAIEAQGVTLVESGQAKGEIVLDAGALTAREHADLLQVGQWLTAAFEKASGARLPVAERPVKDGENALILTTAKAHPELVEKLPLRRENPDAFAIVSTAEKTWLVGASPAGIHHAAAHLLRALGFRSYAPSPRWHIVPKLPELRLELNVTDAPDIGSRSIFYAYGMPDKGLKENYEEWVFANRLTSDSLINTGHSYGHIVGRNLQEFEAHPEYFALLENGERDTKRAVTARKFCTSNPGLRELVVRDRLRLLEEQRQANPLEYMVSLEPSDGEGGCTCPECQKLGTPTDRVFSLANVVARRLREVHPEAWVGLYAYSSHRLPTTIELEPNIYVQVALAFNRTQYTLPELVELWSKKAGAIGLREYYGVEAWDWGLPGRMRGSKVSYHREWIPYYAQRKLTSITAETNANWGGQMLGLDLAAELMWKTGADVDALVDRFFTDCFGPAAAPMKALWSSFDENAQLTPGSLSAMFGELEQAYAATNDVQIRARLTDLMAYLLYVDEYRRFSLVEETQPSHNDAFYEALKRLMTFTWQIRERDMVHYYALARRWTNGVPLQDGRPEFWVGQKGSSPIWMTGAALTDEQIVARFQESARLLREDKTPNLAFSRNLEKADPPGDDAGLSLRAGGPEEVAHFRSALTGYLVPDRPRHIALGVKAVSKPVTLKVYLRGEQTAVEQTVAETASFTEVAFDLPKAGEYRFTLQGEVELRVPPDVPLVYECSASKPAWIDSSGPFYFYVPRGVKQIFVDGDPRLSMHIPGVSARRDLTPRERAEGQTYSVIDVPAGGDGRVWHTDAQTRGRVVFLNIPPLLSANRHLILLPREVAEADGFLTTQ